MSVTIISGPPVSGPQGMSREAAEAALLRNDQFPKGADYTLMAHEGKWVAAVSTPDFDFKKQAEFPPSDSGSGSDSGDDAPPMDGPPADSSPDDSGSDDSDMSGDSGDSEPKKDKGDKDKGGDKGGLKALEAKLDLLLSALGIDPTGMDPGMAGGDPMGGDPMGAPAPPPPMGMGHKDPNVTIHERSMKPGETPPGGTPLGAPAFSSVQVAEDHPWAHLVGKTAAFTVRESMSPDEDITAVHNELQNIAKAGGFKVARFTPFHDQDGGRHVEAVIQTPKTQ